MQPNRISFGFIFLGVSSSCFCFSVKFFEIISANFFKLSYPSLPVNAFAFLVLTIKENTFKSHYLNHRNSWILFLKNSATFEKGLLIIKRFILDIMAAVYSILTLDINRFFDQFRVKYG